MKTGKYIMAAMACLVLATGCNRTNKRVAEEYTAPESEIERFNADDRLADVPFHGVYEGSIPTATEEVEVNVVLTLHADNTFTEHLEYTDRIGEVQYREGTFTRENELLVLDPNQSNEEFYRISGEQLQRLDNDRQPLRGDQSYTLEKIDNYEDIYDDDEVPYPTDGVY